MNISPRNLFTVALASTALLAGCSSDDDDATPTPQDMTVTGQLTALGLTELATLVTAAGLDDDLQGMGPFTVFAPSNAAIQALDPAEVTFLTDPLNQADLIALLQYHVITGQDLDSAAVAGSATLTMDDSNNAIIDTVEGNLYIDNAMIAMADQSAENGTIHVIDSVLRPPTQTVTEALTTAGYDSTMSVITAQSLEATVNAANITVLSPTDAAWAALTAPNDLAFYQDAGNAAEAAALLGLHLHTAAAVQASAAATAGDVASSNGELLFFSDDGTDFTVNGANVVDPNVRASNGLIHGIDAVLSDPGNVVEVATAATTFGTLLTELTEAGLDDDLEGLDTLTAPFTVFAPDDTAIADWVTLTSSDLFSNAARQADATATLSYHVVEGNALQESELAGMTMVTTAQGTDLFITNNNGTLELSATMGGAVLATVSSSNVLANNGVIHVISSVLVPTAVTP